MSGADVVPDGDAAALTAAFAELAADPARRPVLIALDFDGVLAPLRDDPDLSAVLPRGAAALAELADRPGVTLALVSGRSVVDLHRRADPPVGTLLVGSHGGERGRAGEHGLEREPIRLDSDQGDLLTRIGAGLAAAARGRDGVWVQHKPAAAVLHTRMAGPADAAAATALALDLAASLGVEPLHGKDVVEVAVLHATKGQAVVTLRDEVSAAVVVYAGDDTTDEHAFAVLGPKDLAIKVGAGESLAGLRASDPEEFCAQLEAFAAALPRSH